MNDHGLSDLATTRAAHDDHRAIAPGHRPGALRRHSQRAGPRSQPVARHIPDTPCRRHHLLPARGTSDRLACRQPLRSRRRPARVFARGKKMLAANTADLLRMMGREGAMAARYVQSARDMALARLGVRRASAPEQEELLAIIERGNRSLAITMPNWRGKPRLRAPAPTCNASPKKPMPGGRGSRVDINDIKHWAISSAPRWPR